ncbi:MAG: FAD-binding protein [Oscillospiraceae bacterium]|nr:FAD-binding protein [Oscillospiraceae bacterium]
MARIFVITDRRSEWKALVSGAYSISGEKPLVVTADKAIAQAAADFGADAALMSGAEVFWNYTDTIAALVEELQPAGCFFGTSPDCRLVSGRLAAKLGISAIPDAKSIDNTYAIEHLIYGGSVVQTSKSTGKQFVALFGPGQFEEAAIPEQGTVMNVDYVEPKWQIAVKEKKTKEISAVDLTAAKRIVAVGLGISKKEDLDMVRELAALLQAEMACTRPIAEGLDWMEPERYIGISANFVKPDLYISLGISGQVQHTVGITDSKVILSVNKDPDCAMMKQYSDYCVAEDLYKIVPALIERLKK